MADFPPGEYKLCEDYQGDQKTCTHHALSKAVTNNLMDQKIDVAYDVVLGIHLDKFKDVGAKSPTEFHGKSFNIKDKKENVKYWEFVDQIFEKEALDFVYDQSGQTEHYIVSYLAVANKPSSLHCVYVEKYDPKTKTLSCINSWKDYDPKPQLHIDQVVKFYNVSCIAKEIPTPPNSSGQGQGQGGQQTSSAAPVSVGNSAAEGNKGESSASNTSQFSMTVSGGQGFQGVSGSSIIQTNNYYHSK